MKKDICTACDNFTRSKFLSEIVSKWKTLKMEQQMFLVEAVERLIINHDITTMCINVLQEALERMRSSHTKGSCYHVFMLVDTKLLALYSSRNAGQLPKEQLLLLTLIIHILRISFEPFDELAEEVVVKETEDEQFFVPRAKSPETENLKDKKPSKILSKSSPKNEHIEQHHASNDKVRSLLVYMKSRLGSLVPHMVHVIKLTYKINMVILSELTSEGITSSCLYELIESLYNLQQHPSVRRPVCSIDNFELTFKALIDSIWKLKKLEEKQSCMKKLISKWEQMKQCGFETFVKDSAKETVNPRLDSAISALCESLNITFEEVIAEPLLRYERRLQLPEHQVIFQILQRTSMRKLKDVTDFLEVKAVQNITMSSYLAQYPGLIHFIYVDRSSDNVIAPAVVLKKGHLNGTTSLKNKIWKMVSFGRRYVDGANNYCCLWKEEDLYFLYHIWFEDSTGRSVKPTKYPSLKEYPTKGILCGNFFKKLVQDCFPDASYDHIFCYELFCIHLESTPTDVIVDHSRRLCSQLWDFTGAQRMSLDLL